MTPRPPLPPPTPWATYVEFWLHVLGAFFIAEILGPLATAGDLWARLVLDGAKGFAAIFVLVSIWGGILERRARKLYAEIEQIEKEIAASDSRRAALQLEGALRDCLPVERQVPRS